MKNIVITGGSDGLGKELAKQLTAKGHKVVILAPQADKTKQAAADIGCEYQVCDVSKWGQVETAIKGALQSLGSIDVLINNAAVMVGGKLEDMDPKDIQSSYDINVVGVLLVTKAVIPHMKGQGNGHIIMINSQGGLYTKPERTLYSGSKWALTGITKVLQAELAPFNIKVAGLYPGAMEMGGRKDGQRKPQPVSIPYQDMVDAVEYILSRPDSTVITELGLKNLEN